MEPTNFNTYNDITLPGVALNLGAGDLLNFDTQSGQSTQLAVIDSGIENYEQLIQGLGNDTAVLVLDSSADGIFQIDAAINQFQTLTGLHIFSHGSSGQLQLGATQVNTNSLAFYADTLERWDEVLTDTADILLYGCNVADGHVGENFVQRLSSLTGADISASTDTTGAATLGGDWDFEFSTGNIESASVLDGEIQASFSTLLNNDWVVDTDTRFQNERLLNGLIEPIDLAELPDGRLLILQKGGEIKITDPQAANPTVSTYLNITDISTGGERGLISVALDPDFATNNYFYVYYSKASASRFRIARFTHNGNSADLSSEFTVWEDNENYSSNAHYGGGLSFGPDGKLYLTTAEEFDRAQAADLTRAGGKIIRVNKDGTIPTDNPFADGPGGNLDEIWAYGLRNPWRAFWDLPTQRFFINEVGGNDPLTAQEDIHIGEAGANYGWPLYEGISNDPAVSDPLFTYDHSEDSRGAAAISSGIVYRGNNLPNEYNGVYFFGDYAQQWIRYLAFDTNGDVIDADLSTPNVIDAFNFDQGAGRVVSFEEGNDGSLYYLDIYQNPNDLGALRKISFNGGNQAPVIQQATADQTSGSGPLTVNFSSSAIDPENDSLTYTWRFGDGSSDVTGQNVTHTFQNNGVYDVFLSVSDGTNETTSQTPIEVQVGSAPEATIVGPFDGDFFRAGDTINFSGSATDADETLDGSSYEWSFVLLHRGAIHPRFAPVTGTSGSIVIPTNDSLDFSGNTGYEITLKVTDSDGLTDVKQIVVYPEKSDLTFGSNLPEGAVTFTLDDVPRTGSFVYDSAINWQHVVSVPETVTSGGLVYAFDSWSDGVTTASRALTVPESDQSYTASYVVVGQSDSLPVNSGLVLHLDADQSVATDSSGVVTGWQDQSSVGNSVSAAGDPTLVANAINGHSAIRLDGNGDQLSRTLDGSSQLPTGNGDRTVFFVANYRSNGNGGLSYGEAKRGQTFGLIVDRNGNYGTQGWGRANDKISNEVGTGQGWGIQSVTLESGTLTQYKDGTLIDSDIASFNTQLGDLVIGSEIDGSPFVDMDVAEVLIFDRALTASERQQVDAYLQSKYFGGSTGGGSSNNDPTALNDTASTTEGVAVTIDVTDNDSDPDGDPLMLSVTNQPSNGMVSVDNNGTPADVSDDVIVYTPTTGFTGIDSFTYTLNDGNGGSAQATVSVTVDPLTGGNVAPTAVDDTASTLAGVPVSIDVLNNDSDSNGDALLLSVVTAPTKGTAVINDQGTADLSDDEIIYTPTASSIGSDTFVYQVDDGNGGIAQATVNVTVNASGGGSTNVPVSSGLVLHLDAEQSVTTDSSGVVTGWQDQSSAGNSVSASGDPTLVANAINGHSAIRLDGAGDQLSRTLDGSSQLSTGNSDRTVFFVANYRSNGNGGLSYGTASRGKTFGLVVDRNGNYGTQGWGQANDKITNVAGTGQGWGVQSVTLESGILTQYKDGALLDSDVASFNTQLGDLVIGSEIDGSPFVDMDVAEILIFNRALTASERQQVDAYLYAKYFGL